jgi:hypothetical protein
VRRLALAVVLLAACGREGAVPPPPPAKEPAKASGLPDRVPFDQILIAFEGSFPRSDIHRPKEDARRLAESICDRARSGVEFGALKQEYTDERSHGVALGPYVAVKPGITPAPPDEMLPFPGLWDVLCRLKPGEVGLAEYDPRRCPTGWFIVKRLEAR